MKELASATGGQAFTNTNDLARVMRAAADDSEASYTLGFYPHDIRWDNKYHVLKVSVGNSRNGLRIIPKPSRRIGTCRICTSFIRGMTSV